MFLFKAQISSVATATDKCNNLIQQNQLNEAVQQGLISQNTFDQALQNCILDYAATSDLYFGEKAVEYVRNLVNNQWEVQNKNVRKPFCS